jgi:hypothetical protein
VEIGGYNFEHICNIEPLRHSDGSVQALMPQSRYKSVSMIPFNDYGAGPFCKFKIPSSHRISGVYAVSIGTRIQYVGEAANLSARFNAGYGNISPKNCFKGGQETNCRLNHLMYLEAAAGRLISLWLFRTADYKAIEAELRAALRPAWNRA